jgi:hypothetical protein
VKLRTSAIPATVVAFLLSLPWAAAQMPPQATPFSADMQSTAIPPQGGSRKEMSGKVYVSRKHMRMDFTGMGGPGKGRMIMITNFAAKTSDILMPEQHMYMESKADDTQGQRPGMGPSIKPLFDPHNPCANMEGSTCKNLGTEQVNGRTCDHWQVTDKKGKVSNLWIDQKIHFAIKAVSQDSSFELTNIKESEPSASLFEIPSGYQKMDMGGMMKGMRPPQQ